MAKNIYYDEDLREDCRDTITSMIKLYLKFAEKSTEALPTSVVFSADEMMESIENGSLDMKELSVLYMSIVTELETHNMLHKFVKLPLLFLAKETI